MKNRQEQDYLNTVQNTTDIAVLQETVKGLKDLLTTRFSLMDKALAIHTTDIAKHFEAVNNFNTRIKEVNDEKLSINEYKDKHRSLENDIKMLVTFKDTYLPIKGLQIEDAKRINNIESFQNKLLGLAIVFPFILAVGIVILEYLLKH